VPAVGDDAREDVEATGGALRIRLRAHEARQRQAFEERDDIGTVRFEDMTTREIELLEHVVAELRLHGFAVGQKARAYPVGLRSKPQVETCRLHVARRHRITRRRTDHSRGERLLDPLRGEHADRTGIEVERFAG